MVNDVWIRAPRGIMWRSFGESRCPLSLLVSAISHVLFMVVRVDFLRHTADRLKQSFPFANRWMHFETLPIKNLHIDITLAKYISTPSAHRSHLCGRLQSLRWPNYKVYEATPAQRLPAREELHLTLHPRAAGIRAKFDATVMSTSLNEIKNSLSSICRWASHEKCARPRFMGPVNFACKFW